MKTRRFLGWVAMATMVLSTGCSSDEVVNDYSPENAIQFGTYVGRDAESRGTVLDKTTLTDFGVFASYTGQSEWVHANSFNFMFDQKVSRTTTSDPWSYAPLKYWPTTQGDKISFWAYAPYANSKSISVVSDKADTSFPKIKYTLNADNLSEAEDFTADVLMNQTRGGDGNSIDSGERTVSFELQHELSRIGFFAKLDRNAFVTSDAANQTQVNITNITFGGTNFAAEATYSFPITNDVRGTWTLDTDGTKTLDITKLLVRSTESLGGYVVEGTRIPDMTYVNLFGEGNYLFHIPTNGETGAAAVGDVTITISYDIVTIDAGLQAGYSKTSATKRFSLPAGSLKQGKAYRYNLTFGLNEIKLSASVADWDEENVPDDVDWTITDVK